MREYKSNLQQEATINSRLQAYARTLRQHASDAEQQLWRQLRNRRMADYKFRRQEVIEPFIVDFVCFEKKLIIELDGGQHASNQGYDAARTKKLEQMDYRVVRFWNHQVMTRMNDVLAEIRRKLLL